jgi:glutamate decarboxylase
VACQYYLLLRLGRAGYEKIHQDRYGVARYLGRQIAKQPWFETLHAGESDLGIPVVCWKLRDGCGDDKVLVELSQLLRVAGWKIPVYAFVSADGSVLVIRVVARRGFTRDKAELFLHDLHAACMRLRGLGITKVASADVTECTIPIPPMPI